MVNEDLRPPVVELLEKAFIQARAKTIEDVNDSFWDSIDPFWDVGSPFLASFWESFLRGFPVSFEEMAPQASDV